MKNGEGFLGVTLLITPYSSSFQIILNYIL